MSKLSHWLDTVDPYAVQRTILRKALVVSTIMVLVYWLFKPANYIAFILPVFTIGLYEAPVLSRFKQKERALCFIFIAMIICSISFYVIFPFRIFFLLYSCVFFSVLYFLVHRFISPLRNSTMLIMSTSAFFMTIKPYADLQIAYNIFFSSILSMTTLFITLKFLRYGYFGNWLLAQQKFIQSLEQNIHFAMSTSNTSFFMEEVNHIDMVYAYRSLLQKKYLIHAYKISYNMRNIQFALNNIYDQEKHEEFWQRVTYHLHGLRISMRLRRAHYWPEQALNPETLLQKYTMNYLEQAILRWNKLCTLL